MTGRHRGPKQKLRAGYRAPSLKRTSYVATRFHRRVWYRALSLRYACIRSSGIILTPKLSIFVPNFVYFAACIAERAHGENRVLTHSLTHPAYLMPRNWCRQLWDTGALRHVPLDFQHQNIFSSL